MSETTKDNAPDDSDVLWTAIEFGKHVRLSDKTIYRIAAKDPSIPKVRIGGQLKRQARCPGCAACRKPDRAQLDLFERVATTTRGQRLGELELEYVRRVAGKASNR